MRYTNLIILLVIIVGCSTEKSVKSSSEPNLSSLTPVTYIDTLSREEMNNAVGDSLIADSTYDEVTAQLLEAAREHYTRTATLPSHVQHCPISKSRTETHC